MKRVHQIVMGSGDGANAYWSLFTVVLMILCGLLVHASWATKHKAISQPITVTTRNSNHRDSTQRVAAGWVAYPASNLIARLAMPIQTTAISNGPTIDLWYGLHQAFGQIGHPQIWVNVLGNVSDPDGVTSLTYSLNGGPDIPLSIGPDDQRLAAPGDFNADILNTDLLAGPNQLVIKATDTLNNQSTETVTIDYTCGNVWPLPYAIDWSSVTNLQDVAQVVDGQWTRETDSIRPMDIAYDRLLSFGDITWMDYEVTVPITLHGLVLGGPSGPPGCGLVMRWTGHTDDPIPDMQPKAGCFPLGAIGMWRWDSTGTSAKLQFWETDISQNFTPVLEVCYLFKMRVQSTPDHGGLYSLKVWQQGTSEPADWNLTYQADTSNLQNGSCLLLAHHVDASLGDVTVTALPLAIANIRVTLNEDHTAATLTWTTNEPATSSVSFGPTTAYENGTLHDSTLTTHHTMSLTDLNADTVYHYQLTSTNGSSQTVYSANRTFATHVSNIVSDDFNTCRLNTSLWTFVDPVGDSTLTLTETHTPNACATIAIPAGTDHDIWTSGNFAPRLMQPANDANFEIEAKFDSPLTEQYQMAGLLAKQSDTDFVRFDFYSTDSETRIFAASFTTGSVSTRNNRVIPNGYPLVMRVRREDHHWTQSYSYDGQTWITATTFYHPMAVTAVGPFVGNATGTSSPAYTGSIDYFFNTASPIAPEDGLPHTPSPGDFDDDCDVDDNDLTTFISCASGPAVPHNGTPTCQDADFDQDGDVDTSDFATLQRCISGPGNPADPACAN